MSPDQFWQIVDDVLAVSPDDMATKCKNLEAALRARPLHNVLHFERHFRRSYFDAYTWDLWAAAFIIGDGCSDDSFMDFRSVLISMGKKAYSDALDNPETLVDTNMHADWAHFEGYQYVASNVWQEVVGKEFPPDMNERAREHPKEPVGIRFVEWELSVRFPKLAEKFGFKDSDWFFLRDKKLAEETKQQRAEKVATLLLKTQLIPRTGLIPPYRLLRSVLLAGSASEIGNDSATWKPFDLDEGVYWAAVVHLENLTQDQLAGYSHFKVSQLKQDLTTDAKTFAEWIGSTAK